MLSMAEGEDGEAKKKDVKLFLGHMGHLMARSDGDRKSCARWPQCVLFFDPTCLYILLCYKYMTSDQLRL